MSKFPFHVPDWARGIVWYQIMPERFRNGDPNNTPRALDQKNAWPHDHTSPLELHPWTSDWYRPQPWERENGRDIWFNLQRRRYGGDLQGIIDQLDYLQDLGVGGLYLNPVFQAPSAHKYDGATYHHVDPTFGPDPAGDRRIMARETPHDPSTWEWTSADELLLQLTEEVHRRDMYLILDGVFNHMGLNSWIYQDILRRQQDSPFRDWMQVESWADNPGSHDPSSPFRPGFSVRTWEGFNELPELREDRRGIVAGPREYIFNITRRWMDPYENGERISGVDGWRLDVAFCVKHPFWKAWRKHVRSINPDAYLVAEVIDSIKKTFPYVKGDEFDAVMNYNFTFACNDFFVWTENGKNRISASGFAERLEALMTSFPEPVPHVMQNLLGSHDTDRVASRIVNRGMGAGMGWGEFFQKSKRAENGAYDTRKPTPEEDRIKRLMVMAQFTFPGAPMIYYGDEAGMWGANDPCCRKPMVWPDYEYEPETLLPDGSMRSRKESVAFDPKLHAWHRELARLRNGHPALRYGGYETLFTDNRQNVLVFRREYEGCSVYVAIHNGESGASVEVPLEDLAANTADGKAGRKPRILFDGSEIYPVEDGDRPASVSWGDEAKAAVTEPSKQNGSDEGASPATVVITLPPFSGIIFE
ncbi:glycoside hydrolase family 13 protein [Balneolales bacterium ANBcel1]|nr:glycoside hydrolase family 13 protein [Balneolales bacterium ANBcel1]